MSHAVRGCDKFRSIISKYHDLDCGHLTRYSSLLKGFVDGNFEWNFHTFVRSN